jgi:hypothetical protein
MSWLFQALLRRYERDFSEANLLFKSKLFC